MVSLTFTKETGSSFWKATATVNADFNLHIERAKSEYITVDVTTVKNGATQCVYASKEGEVFDHDFDAIVYPKYITVCSWSEPTDGKCYITEEA